MQSDTKKGFIGIAKDLTNLDFAKDKYVSREFQKYGYDLAVELEDAKNVSLYIKIAKVNERGLIERARSFVKDASNVRSRPALFLWKLKELKEEKKLKSKGKI